MDNNLKKNKKTKHKTFWDVHALKFYFIINMTSLSLSDPSFYMTHKMAAVSENVLGAVAVDPLHRDIKGKTCYQL